MLDYEGPQIIGKTEMFAGQGSSYSGDDHLRVSNAYPLFENKNIGGRNTSKMSEYTVGSGAIATFANYSAVQLSVTTANGDHAERRSDQYIPYLPGSVQFVSLTHIFNAPKANLQQWCGHCCDTDGLLFRTNGTDLEFVLRSSVTGATVETVYSRYEADGVTPAWTQPDGTKDALDGRGPSNIDIDVTKIQLTRFRFLWQGAAFFSFGFKIDGRTIWAHHVNVANHFSTPFMRLPSLPVCYGIKNIGTTASASTMYEVCSAAFAEGGYALPGSEYSVNVGNTLIGVTSTETSLLGLRLSQNFAGVPNRHQARISHYDFMAKTNDCLFEVYHIHNPWYTLTHGGETAGPVAPGDTFDNGAGVTGVVVARIGATSFTYRETGGTGVFAAGQTLSNGVWSVTIAANGVPAWITSGDDSATEYAIELGTVGGDHVHRIESKPVPVGLAAAGGESTVSIDSLSHHNVIYQNYDSSNSDLILIEAASFASVGSSNVATGMTVTESN